MFKVFWQVFADISHPVASVLTLDKRESGAPPRAANPTPLPFGTADFTWAPCQAAVGIVRDLHRRPCRMLLSWAIIVWHLTTQHSWVVLPDFPLCLCSCFSLRVKFGKLKSAPPRLLSCLSWIVLFFCVCPPLSVVFPPRQPDCETADRYQLYSNGAVRRIQSLFWPALLTAAEGK